MFANARTRPRTFEKVSEWELLSSCCPQLPLVASRCRPAPAQLPPSCPAAPTAQLHLPPSCPPATAQLPPSCPQLLPATSPHPHLPPPSNAQLPPVAAQLPSAAPGNARGRQVLSSCPPPCPQLLPSCRPANTHLLRQRSPDAAQLPPSFCAATTQVPLASPQFHPAAAQLPPSCPQPRP